MRFEKGKFVVASLGGAIAIHAALIACGGVGGSDGSAGGSLLDAIASLVDSESREAAAADPPVCCETKAPPIPASENPSQWVMGTGVVRGPGGSADIPVQLKLADGPLFLERATVSGTLQVAQIYVSSTADCLGQSVSLGHVGWVQVVPNQATHNFSQSTPSGRAFVPAGMFLCARSVSYLTDAQSVGVSWQGFKPN